MAEFKFYLDRRIMSWRRDHYTIEGHNIEQAKINAGALLFQSQYPPMGEDIEDLGDSKFINMSNIDEITSGKELYYHDPNQEGHLELLATDERRKKTEKEKIIIKIVNGEIQCSDPRVEIIDLDDEGISDEEETVKAKELLEKTRVLTRKERKEKKDAERKLRREKATASNPYDKNEFYSWMLKQDTVDVPNPLINAGF